MTASRSLAADLNRIQHQDCIAGMNALPAGSVDLAFADPPFNIGYDYDVYHDKQKHEHYLDWSRQWIEAVHRVLKPDGTFWLAIGDEYAAELKILSQELGFHSRSWVIWYYTFGVNCKTKFSRSHAHLFHFVKNTKRFTYRCDELENRIPSARLVVYGDSRGNPDGRLPDDTWILRPQDLAGHFTPEEDTWYFPRVAGTFKERAGFHGCQMPEQLLGRIIRICSHENDVVLDPFSGSATTLAVAKKLGRRYLGFDLSPDYVERGTARLAGIRVGDPLDGAPEPTMSAPATAAKNSKGKRGDASPLAVILEQSAIGQRVRMQEAFDRGVVEAFRAVRDGFSADRVVADPEINVAFADRCRQAGIEGDIRAWNHRLLALRKAGRLADLPTTRRTEFTWEQCDAFLFASEIAWKRMLDADCKSLDEIFCDPESALQFDQLASDYAPGFPSLMYRWGALKLRKESKSARERSELLAAGRFGNPIAIDARSIESTPTAAGVYLVRRRRTKEPLYVGEALDLRSRLLQQFGADRAQSWRRRCGAPLEVAFFGAESNARLLLAYQSLCVRLHRPTLNIPDLALT